MTYDNLELHPIFLCSISQDLGRIAHVFRPPVVLHPVSAVNAETFYDLAPSCPPFPGNLVDSPTSSSGTSHATPPVTLNAASLRNRERWNSLCPCFVLLSIPRVPG